jgi:hypothetical protein
MSVVWGWPLSGNRKVVALALADEANDSGVCWPSQKRLARKCRLSTRRLRDHLKALEADSKLVREQRHRDDGSRSSDGYRLVLADETSPPPDETSTGRQRPGTDPKTRTTTSSSSDVPELLGEGEEAISSEKNDHDREGAAA